MMTEKDKQSLEMFNRQAMMNGERVPVIFTRMPVDLDLDTNGTAWIGDVLSSNEFVPKTTSESQGATMPWAIQYLNCEEDVVNLCGGRGKDKYNAYCWVKRSDVTLETETGRYPMANRQPKSQASWHPGWRVHQFESRKVALVFLNAFKKAFKIWEDGIKDQFPLDVKYWHVGSIYKDIQKNFVENIKGVRKGNSHCEKYFEKHNLEKMCYTMMHGMSEFTPVNIGYENSIIKHARKGENGFPKQVGVMPYVGPDLLPLKWKIPDGDVDVHAIAIASNYEAPNFDHLFEEEIEEDNDEDAEDAEDERRDLSAQDTSRFVSSTGIVPGEGWASSVFKETGVQEYCDGSAMSECNRGGWCATEGSNDRHGCLSGDGLSGWLVIDIPHVEEGIILAKSEVSKG